VARAVAVLGGVLGAVGLVVLAVVVGLGVVEVGGVPVPLGVCGAAR
jgi:hypothetical protein